MSEVRLVPEGLTGGPTSKEALAAELRRLLLAAERRQGGRGRLKRSTLARRVGVSASSLYAYLDGTTLPPTDVLDRLHDALDVAAAERGRLATARDLIEIARRSRPTRSTTDDHTRQPLEGPLAPRQLPASPQMFTGRAHELFEIEQAHDASTVVISAIDGMAGVGKTALAAHAGHRIADRYPDGQLFIDLHGFTDSMAPVEPGDALDRLLRALGVPGEQIPVGLEDRAGLWRSVLSERRILIVLDNAATETQVAPLLPGAPGCLVLITSRRRLTGLDATHTLSLDTLPIPEAITLLIRTAGEDRLADQPPELVATLVELCGRLPLAIRIAAARLRSHPTWRVSHLVERLRDQRHLLGELAAGQRSVTAALDLSYQHLSVDQQQAYRLAGLHPGPEFDSYATAALLDSSLLHASRVLERLLEAHLLQEPTPGRYRFHDLARAHAAHTATGDQTAPSSDALRRLLDYYRHTAAAAMDAAYPYERKRRPPVPSADTPTPDLSHPTGALEWLKTELPNLLAIAAAAADHGRSQYTAHLSRILREHLYVSDRYQDAEALHHRALSVARGSDDPQGQMEAQFALGQVYRQQGNYGPAADHYQQTLELARTTRNRHAEFDALYGLGQINRLQCQNEQAIRQLRQGLAIARATSNRHGELNTLHALGQIHRTLGRFQLATDHYEQALDIARTIGNRLGELNALNSLGWIQQAHGRYHRAAELHQQALGLARTIGNHVGELNALRGLGMAHRAQGRHDAAADCYQRALETTRATGNRQGELYALYGLGHTLREQGEYERAADNYQQALDIAQELSDRNGRLQALLGLGRLHCAAGHPQTALDPCENGLSRHECGCCASMNGSDPGWGGRSATRRGWEAWLQVAHGVRP
jgi:tetratricopeptide (TPR) repeat protein/transcriptional regulator with XRE-family HTH domain